MLLIVLCASQGICIENPSSMADWSNERLISHYFYSGLPYIEMLSFLSTYHGIILSMRQLHRVLRKLKLYRRHQHCPINNVILFIQSEIKGSCSSIGYRAMHQKLRQANYVVDRETDRLILKTLDPVSVESRKSHKLIRRQYSSPGPNFTWHIDGYDKLKPYGFAIHGVIDGYSKK